MNPLSPPNRKLHNMYAEEHTNVFYEQIACRLWVLLWFYPWRSVKYKLCFIRLDTRSGKAPSSLQMWLWLKQDIIITITIVYKTHNIIGFLLVNIYSKTIQLDNIILTCYSMRYKPKIIDSIVDKQPLLMSHIKKASTFHQQFYKCDKFLSFSSVVVMFTGDKSRVDVCVANRDKCFYSDAEPLCEWDCWLNNRATIVCL